jgi:hypothetical protein
MITLFTLIALFVSSTSISNFKYSSCGKTTDIAQNIVLDIDPIIPQADYTLYLNADFSKQVNKGISKYIVTYNYIPLSPTVYDLCTEISKSNITCPLNNHISSQSKGSIPSGLSGTTTIKNEWFTDTTPEERILCMLFTIQN